MFEFCIKGIWFEWNGAHTVNVYFDPADMRAGGDGYNTDVFSLDYSRDDLTELDAMVAALEWMNVNV